MPAVYYFKESTKTKIRNFFLCKKVKRSSKIEKAQRRSRKVLKKIFINLLIVFLVTGLISTALAQRQTGSIQGKVIDAQGYPLAGAFIYVTSPAMLGMRTYLTAEKGVFRIASLPPGRFKVTVEMPGFKTVNMEDIIVRVGMTVTLKIALESSTVEEEVTIKAPSPTLDAESTKTAVVVDEDLLENIPFPRNFHDVIHSAPGVVSEKNLYKDQSSVHGSTLRANTYALDWLQVNDPSERNLLAKINFDIIEEVEIESAGHPVDVGLIEGGYINVVTKSGGNNFGRTLKFDYTDDTMASRLRPGEKLNVPDVSPPVRDKNLWDLSFSLGGPLLLEDILWFFGNIRLIYQFQTTPFIPWTDHQGTEHRKFEFQNDDKMGFIKLSSRFIPQLNVSAMFNYGDRYQSVWYQDVGWNIPGDSTRSLYHEKNYTASGLLSYALDQNTSADLKAGYFYDNIPLKLNPKAWNSAQYFDEGTGRIWGSNGFNETRQQKRFQAGAYLTHFKDKLLGAAHELKIGAEYEYAFGELFTWKQDNLLTYYYFGSPYYFGMEESPQSGNIVGKGKISFSIAAEEKIGLSTKSELKRLGFFIQDSAKFGDRLTFLFGLRFDRSSTRLFDLAKGESGNPVSLKIGDELINPTYEVNPFALVATQQWSDLLTWNTFSPRAGLNFDIFGKGKTILRASYSRYSEYVLLEYLAHLNPLYAQRSHQFYWYDENMDGHVDEEDTFTLFPEDYHQYTFGYYQKRIDPNIKSPHSDEWTIGLSQKLFKDFSLSVSYIHKTNKDILEDVLYAPDQDIDWYTMNAGTEDWWIPFDTIVPGTDDYPETAVRAYFWSNSAPALFYRFKNVPELRRKYQALEIVLKKRMSNNWQLYGSLVLSRASGNIGLGDETSYGFSSAADSPNSFVNLEDARLDYDRPVVAKLMGTYGLPFKLNLSFYYIYASGTPWARTVTIIPPSAWTQANDAFNNPVTVYLEKPGTRRTADVSRLDLRIEKAFRMGKSGEFSTYFDILNVFGNKSSFNFPDDGGFWFPDDENTNQGIRLLNPNYRKTELLLGTRVVKLSLNFNF